MQDRFKIRCFYKGEMHDDISYQILEDYGYDTFAELSEYHTIMACTGLKDKNNKLIYEGDIIKTAKHNLCNKNQIFEIIWHKDYAQFLAKNINLFCIDLTDAYLCEIIGNIYENPELLN